MTRLIVSFSGRGIKPLQAPRKEFERTLDRLFPEDKKMFFLDKSNVFYHKGISGLTEDVRSTVEFLRDLSGPYEETVFMGSSAGGYASILFGSLLGVSKVIAFIPQTLIKGYVKTMPIEYEDLNSVINDHTKYFVHGCVKERHDAWHGRIHVDNISGHGNVVVEFHNPLCMKKLRDSGRLDEILLSRIGGA